MALRRRGIATTLLAGDATPPGLELAARYGLPADAYRVSEVMPPDSLQWTPAPGFAGWLGPRLAQASLVHAHMMGAWWAAARALPPRVLSAAAAVYAGAYRQLLASRATSGKPTGPRP